MEQSEFRDRIAALLPGARQEVIESWVQGDNKYRKEGLTDTYLRDAYIELELTASHYGTDTARQIFDLGADCALNAFEIRGAARFLHEGVPIEDVAEKVLDGHCTKTTQEWEETRAALAAWVKPSVMEQIKNAREEAKEKPTPAKDTIAKGRGPEL